MSDDESVPSFDGYMFGEADKRLSDEEEEELNELLGDGFSSIFLLPDFGIAELGAPFEEPFFGATIRADERTQRHFLEFKEDALAEGFTESEIGELYLNHVEFDRDEDEPSWQETNPFSVKSFRSLRHYFARQLEKSLGKDASLLRRNGGPSRERDFIELSKPFSMPWFEAHIVSEIEILGWMFEDATKPDKPASAFWTMALMCHSAVTGRLIEHYRWRFAHGSHALRGKKTLASSSMGGAARAASTSSRREAILAEMLRHINKGHTISRAAAFAAGKGHGASPGANRKLWHRYKK